MADSMKVYVSYMSTDNNLSKAEEIILKSDETSSKKLVESINEAFQLSSDKYDLYFGLKCLDCSTDCDLSKLGIRSGCKLYAICKKSSPPKPEIEKVDISELDRAVHGLHMMFLLDAEKKRRMKSPITKLFEDKESMQSIILIVEGLSDDQTALDILENIKLFEILIHPKNTKIVLEKHPALAAAITTIWQSVKSSPHAAYGASTIPNATQNSMDTEDNYMPSTSSQQPTSGRSQTGRNRTNIITSSQLAAAIAQATSPGGGPMFNYSPYNTPTSSSVQSPMNVGSSGGRSGNLTPAEGAEGGQARRNPSQPPITPDVFSRAMQQALMSTGLQEVTESLQGDGIDANVRPVVSEEVMQAGLNQLRLMGITDDAASRQALTATHGNVEAAVNLLFTGN